VTTGLRRVLAVCVEAPPDVVGGLGRYTERMVREWRAGDVAVDLFATTGGRPGRERDGRVVLHRIRVPAPARWAPRPVLGDLARVAGLALFTARTAARVLRAERTGAVLAVHDWTGVPTGLLCGLLGRLPVVFHLHREEPGGRSPLRALMTLLERAQARAAAAVVVPSAGLRARLIARGWPAERVHVVAHGADDPDLRRVADLPEPERARLRAGVRRRYLPGGSGHLVLYAGRLAAHKGVATLVRAVPHVAAEVADVRVVVAGGGDPRTGDGAALARLVDELGLGGRVALTGRMLDPPELYAHMLAADLCVFPSTHEPFGLVAVEAMALGRPVVVGPGYSPDVVGEGALRCPADAPPDLARAVVAGLREPDALAERARRHAAGLPPWSATARQTLALYAEVLARGGAR
jgi:glycogen synthase